MMKVTCSNMLFSFTWEKNDDEGNLFRHVIFVYMYFTLCIALIRGVMVDWAFQKQFPFHSLVYATCIPTVPYEHFTHTVGFHWYLFHP